MSNVNDDTESFVKKIKENQEKDDKNRRTQGDGHPGKHLPNNRR